MKTSNRQESLKKYFYSGIGHISHATEVIQKSAQELTRQRKVSESDGKRIVNNAIGDIERKYNEAVHKLATFTQSEVNALRDSLAKMEKRVLVKNQKAVRQDVRAGKMNGKKRNHVTARAVHVAS